jgi:hypothetical protein
MIERNKSRLTTLFVLLALCLAFSTRAHADGKTFTIYEFIPYRDHVMAGSAVPSPQLEQYLDSLNIHHIKVIYMKRFLTDGKPDDKEIEDIAKAAISSPKTPVSFDTEFGNRFTPETVIPGVSQILDTYHRYNTVTPVGVYATAPQNTYAWKPDIKRFDALNKEYATIAQKVDFLSPVLYNYEGADTTAWQRAAVYNMAAAKSYNTGKPILPYINVTVRLQSPGKDDSDQHGPVRTLTEAEMLTRLQTLYDLGANGCIVWASSKDRTIDGNMPIFDRNSGWGKALADFAKAHQ